MADLGREGCPKVGTTRNKAAPKVRWDRHLFLESPKVGIFFCGIDVREWPATPFLHAPLTLDAAHRALITAACGEHLALKTILMTHIARLAQARRVTTAIRRLCHTVGVHLHLAAIRGARSKAFGRGGMSIG
jgi:hypothetical protein